ncbi:type II toxin-antitoxin system HipA family toxin [Spongiimicrobium sp. 2-473A-2-J]|uniref:type II toxin-antitoxin system HipA family toxin n=1 Tax=Eudoraea algarum TaxID=3417568 RepID=UPI003D367528
MAQAEIEIWGIYVGAVIWDDKKNLAIFEFDKKFINKEIDLAPITMPLEQLKRGDRIYSFPQLNEITFKKLPGMLADSLPDKFGNKLINLWLAQTGRSQNDFTPVERLCYVGKRAMGALEFKKALVKESISQEEIQLSELVAIANKVMSQKEALDISFKIGETKALERIIAVGTSAGGMRPKAVIAVHKKNGKIISGHVQSNGNYEHWILKFDGVQDEIFGDPRGYGIIEYVYYKMATDANIEMSQCKLLEEDSRSHFMTKRFDRKNGKKIHMQTLTGIAHYDFNDIGSTSYEQLFQIMRKLKLGNDEMEQMYRRLVFNIVGRNQDDHTKNVSFLLAENESWKLSPAYDMTYSYNPIKGRNTNKHQMSVNGKRENIDKKDLLKIAQDIDIKKPNEIIDQVKEAVSQWAVYAKYSGLEKERIKKIEQNLKLDL